MFNSKTKIIVVDFQKDFTVEGGFVYKKRPSVDFVKNKIIPFLKENKIKIAEIISDYREVSVSSRGYFCIPGEDGYLSEIPDDVKLENIWIKCSHSPIWTRENIGVEDKKPGKPYTDPKAFEEWLFTTVGKPENVDEVILIGLTVNCCILSVAQELFSRGYKVKIIEEATDDYSGEEIPKNSALTLIKGNYWAEIISWNDIKNQFKK